MSDAIIFLGPAFAACLVIASLHVYLGLHILAREIIFIDLSLAQLAALGATIGVFLGAEEGGQVSHALAFVFTAVGAALFATMRRARHQISQEAIIGIAYAVASAVMILVVSRSPHGAEHIQHALVGSLLATTWTDVLRTLALYVALGVIHVIFRTRFIQMSWRPDEADAQIPNLVWWEFGFYLLFGIMITISVEIVGVLLAFSFLIVPAVITNLFSSSIARRLVLGWVVAVLASLLGLFASWTWDLPTGATIVTACGFLLLLAGFVHLGLRRS